MKPLRLLAATLAVLLACEPALMAAGSVRVVPARTGAYSPLLPAALPAGVPVAPNISASRAPEAAIASEDLHVSPEVLAAETGARFDRSQAQPRPVSIDVNPAPAPAQTLARPTLPTSKKRRRDPIQALEVGGVILTGAANVLVLDAFGWWAMPGILAAWGLANWWASRSPPRSAKLSRSLKSRLKLQARIKHELRGLLKRSSWPLAQPRIAISNASGPSNAFASGEGARTMIAFGEDWIKRSVPEMIGVLGHELGHLYYGDTRDLFWNREAHSSFGAAVAVISLTTFYISMMIGKPLPAVFLAGGLAIIGSLTSSGSSRLRERRADLFSARLVGADKAALHFGGLPPVGKADLLGWVIGKIPSLLSTHPRLETRVAYLRREAKRQAARSAAGRP